MSANHSSSERIRTTIRKLKTSVFTTRDVMMVSPDASRELVDQVLSRMVRSGELQRVSRGIFSRPNVHRELGRLAPHSEDITAAIERKIGLPVIPSGALALNELHLSTQVPAKLEFKTAGPSRVLQIGKRQITLRHAPASRFRSGERIVSLVVEALGALGKLRVTEEVINSLRNTLSDNDRFILKKHIGSGPVWMQRYLREITK